MTPCIVKYADGKVREEKLLTTSREVDGKLVGHIPATWGKAREMKGDELQQILKEQDTRK